MSLGHRGSVTDPSAYARSAFEDECALVASSGSGRNEQLNISAFKLGRLIGSGALDRREVENGLYEAACASGYVKKDGPADARRTIKSGLDNGVRQPRQGLNDNHHVEPIVFRPKPKIESVPVPDWTEPDETGKPRFFAIGKDTPTPFTGEVRRHVYYRDGQAVRVKIKNKPEPGKPAWSDLYQVKRSTDGKVGWQARKPVGFEPVPYTGSAGSPNPFDPELAGDEIVWAEGEKDVDTLVSRGVIAFTFGSASDVPDCTDLLRGRQVILCADNDAAGEKSISRRHEVIKDAAALVRVVRFRDLGKEGADATDFFEAGRTTEEFFARATPIAEAVEPSQAKPKSLLLVYGDVEPEPPPWLIKGLLPQGQVAILAGQWSAGKTFLAIEAAFSIMTGMPFNGHDIERRGGVLWLAAEGHREVFIRLSAAALHRTGGKMLGELPFVLQAFEVPTLTEADALPKLIEHTEAARECFAERFPGVELALVIIDTLNSAAGFEDENSASETQKVFNALRKLSDSANALVMVVDHYGKTSSTGVRGSSAKPGAAEAILSALADKGDEGKIGNRRLTVTKMRGGETGKVLPFALATVLIDEDGNTSCGIDWAGDAYQSDVLTVTPSEKPKPAWPSRLRLFRNVLQTVMIESGERWSPYGAEGKEVKAIPLERARTEFIKRYTADTVEAKSTQWRRNLADASAKLGLIASLDRGGVDWIWFTKDDDTQADVLIDAAAARKKGRDLGKAVP